VFLFALAVPLTVGWVVALLAGPAASAFGAPAALTAGGILIVMLSVAALLVPQVRMMRRQEPVRPGASAGA
jgi:hypothetical protein